MPAATTPTTPAATMPTTPAATAPRIPSPRPPANGVGAGLDAALPPPPRADAVWRRAAAAVLSRWLRVETTGVAQVPASGGVLVAATHTSHADSPALGLAIERPLSFLGDQRLVDWPLIGRRLPAMGMVPVDRGSADLGALSHLAALLTAGHAVVVYPEGSRSRDGAVHKPRSGVARLAAATGVPVVPVGISGAVDAWPIDARPRLRPMPVRVSIGAPLAAPADTPAARRRFNAELHEVLVALSGAPRSEEFAPIARPAR